VTAWKDWERRACRALGGQRGGPQGAAVSDCVGTPWSVECKRVTRPCLRSEWLSQARSQSKKEGKPWLLLISGHNDRRPIAVLDFLAFCQLAEEAGRIDTGQLALTPDE
jgi:hypothetical protein